ncbi:MAG: hypothetical protein EAX87_00735 [Candidatus Thorarchaeota archaeon]|nr:hypothetical protein [Candidatus Thorarchaeota archaeon]
MVDEGQADCGACISCIGGIIILVTIYIVPIFFSAFAGIDLMFALLGLGLIILTIAVAIAANYERPYIFLFGGLICLMLGVLGIMVTPVGSAIAIFGAFVIIHGVFKGYDPRKGPFTMSRKHSWALTELQEGDETGQIGFRTSLPNLGTVLYLVKWYRNAGKASDEFNRLKENMGRMGAHQDEQRTIRYSGHDAECVDGSSKEGWPMRILFHYCEHLEYYIITLINASGKAAVYGLDAAVAIAQCHEEVKEGGQE